MDVIAVNVELHGVRVWLETDLRNDFGPGILGIQCIDGSKRWVDLRPFNGQVYEAITRLTLARLSVERITIIQGRVAAHPPASQHHQCPFCYGPIETLWGPVGRFSGRLAG